MAFVFTKELSVFVMCGGFMTLRVWFCESMVKAFEGLVTFV